MRVDALTLYALVADLYYCYDGRFSCCNIDPYIILQCAHALSNLGGRKVYLTHAKYAIAKVIKQREENTNYSEEIQLRVKNTSNLIWNKLFKKEEN